MQLPGSVQAPTCPMHAHIIILFTSLTHSYHITPFEMPVMHSNHSYNYVI